MSPASASSTPAIRRSSTVFPAPEGPNTTTISPVSALSETSSSTAPVLNSLRILRTSTCAIGSAFHRAKGKPFNEIALGIQRDRQSRSDRQNDGGGDLPVLDARRGHKGERADRYGLLVG